MGPDYRCGDFGGSGYYRVWFGRGEAPAGPYPDIAALAQATGLRSYPHDGYVVHYEAGEAAPTNVPSLNPDDLLPATPTTTSNPED